MFKLHHSSITLEPFFKQTDRKTTDIFPLTEVAGFRGSNRPAYMEIFDEGHSPQMRRIFHHRPTHLPNIQVSCSLLINNPAGFPRALQNKREQTGDSPDSQNKRIPHTAPKTRHHQGTAKSKLHRLGHDNVSLNPGLVGRRRVLEILRDLSPAG